MGAVGDRRATAGTGVGLEGVDLGIGPRLVVEVDLTLVLGQSCTGRATTRSASSRSARQGLSIRHHVDVEAVP